jgi:uncharacterized lipoprotein YmbA
MKARFLLLACAALLSGCIIFDKKSEAVTFHQLASPAATTIAPAKRGPLVFVPRAIIPSALRRPNLVLLDDTGWVRVEDAHRWIAPLDRAFAETVGRHLTALTGVATVAQSPAEDHQVLLLTVDRMEVFTAAAAGRSLFTLPGTSENKDTAILQVTYRLEKSDGTTLATGTLSRSAPLKERTPTEFVRVQSANVASLTQDLAKLFTPSPVSK